MQINFVLVNNKTYKVIFQKKKKEKKKVYKSRKKYAILFFIVFYISVSVVCFQILFFFFLPKSRQKYNKNFICNEFEQIFRFQQSANPKCNFFCTAKDKKHSKNIIYLRYRLIVPQNNWIQQMGQLTKGNTSVTIPIEHPKLLLQFIDGCSMFWRFTHISDKFFFANLSIC